MEIKTPIDAPDKKENFIVKMRELFPAAKPEELEVAWTKHSNKTLTERIIETMSAYGNELVAELNKSFQEQLQAKVKEQEKALIDGVMKGLGLDKNQPVTLSEVEEVVRKIMLDNTDPGKKTNVIDKPEEKGETGDNPKAPFDFNKRFADDIAKQGVIV